MLSATVPENKITLEDSILTREYFGPEVTHINFAQDLLGLISSINFFTTTIRTGNDLYL